MFFHILAVFGKNRPSNRLPPCSLWGWHPLLGKHWISNTKSSSFVKASSCINLLYTEFLFQNMCLSGYVNFWFTICLLTHALHILMNRWGGGGGFWIERNSSFSSFSLYNKTSLSLKSSINDLFEFRKSWQYPKTKKLPGLKIPI